MDEQAKEAYGRMADVVIKMTAAANQLASCIDELTSAVQTLTGAVSSLERRRDSVVPAE
jgi:outer membrane murein-binding lipoprotein Lpp